jgi:hypothetical protein
LNRRKALNGAKRLNVWNVWNGPIPMPIRQGEQNAGHGTTAVEIQHFSPAAFVA